MDIPSLSMAISQYEAVETQSFSMMKKALEMVEQKGEVIAEMMDDMSQFIDVKL
jgi:hypothetical protein